MTNVRCLLIMFVKLHAVCPGLSARGSVGPDQRRQNFVSSKPGSQESHALPQLLTPPPPGACYLPPRYRRVTHRCAGGELGTDSSPIRRKMGGSYSRYTGAAPLSQLQRGLTIDTRYRRR